MVDGWARVFTEVEQSARRFGRDLVGLEYSLSVKENDTPTE